MYALLLLQVILYKTVVDIFFTVSQSDRYIYTTAIGKQQLCFLGLSFT